MPKSKKQPQKIKFHRNKTKLFAIFVFALIGTIFLYRGFASTATVEYRGNLTKGNSSNEFTVVAGEGELVAQHDSRDSNFRVSIADDSGNILAQNSGARALVSAQVPGGEYVITIDYLDTIKGSKKFKVSITYNDSDFEPPEVAFTSDITGEIKGSFSVSVSATDNRSIEKVELYLNSNLHAQTSSQPYEFTVDTAQLSNGESTIVAKAYDFAGNVGQASGTILINNGTTSDPPQSNGPSGEAMPIGDLPGWRQIFTDDFNQNVPLGSFPSAVSEKWGAYPYPWRDTRGQRTSDPTIGGWYHPERTVSFKNGVMDIWLHTENLDGAEKRLVAAPQPKIKGPNTTGREGQLYGRYAVRFRADQLKGYKTAWLLWPDSGIWPRDGEIDFPEGNLDGSIKGFMHWQNASSGSEQYYALSGRNYNDWHTAVIEWSPEVTSFYLDGQLITNASGGSSSWTDKIPNTPMHWVLQTETALSGEVPSVLTEGHVEIDWVAVWAKN